MQTRLATQVSSIEYRAQFWYDKVSRRLCSWTDLDLEGVVGEDEDEEEDGGQGDERLHRHRVDRRL